MPIKTFEPSIPPASPTTMKPKFDILSTDFGDGYTQETGNGINYRRYTLTLNWKLLSPPEADELIAFLEGQKGVDPFWYKPVNSLKRRKWTCKDWSDTASDNGFREIQVTFVESFSLLT